MPSIKYRKEFFDREYTSWNAYRRVWKYARKYKFRLLVGVLTGMLTAGTLVPFFQIVQPALQHVESHDVSVVKDEGAANEASVDVAQSQARTKDKKRKNAFEKEIDRNSKLPSWYPKVEKLAAKC